MKDTKTKKEDALRREFAMGVLFSAQFLAINHDKEELAEDLLRESFVPRKELLAAQRLSGYESRKMCRLIRRAR